MQEQICKFISHKNKISYDSCYFRGNLYKINPYYGFCVISEEDNNVLDFGTSTTHFGQNASKILYSVNNHNWLSLQGTTSYTLNKGEKIFFKTTSSIHKTSASELPILKSSKMFSIQGDFGTLVSSVPNYGLYAFFQGTKIKECNILFDFTSFGDYALSNMFKNCTNLEYVDFYNGYNFLNYIIDTESLGSHCFKSTFENCSSLISFKNSVYIFWNESIPNYCCYNMYKGCIKLKTPPIISFAGNLAGDNNDNKFSVGEYGFAYMFYDCKSLTSESLATEDILNSTKSVSRYAYAHMYENCISFNPIQQISLPKPQSEYCYSYMFKGCTSFNQQIIIAPDTRLSVHSCEYMFYGCSSLTKGPKLRCDLIGDYACQYMYAYCPKLKYIYISGIPGTWSGWLPDRNNGTYHWIYGGVAAKGDYYYPNNLGTFFTGLSDAYARFPSGWTAHAVSQGT